jgi:hypothetical protein
MIDPSESDSSQVLRLREGWYLMSVRDLEIELSRWRGDAAGERSNALPLSIEEALAFRDAGNVPDELGRSLRLVLLPDGETGTLDEPRRRWEPDFHDAPDWRREGSVPVNVVPLRDRPPDPRPEIAWWDDPEMARMEEEWQRSGAVAGLRIPGAYRGFVYKTIRSLRSDARAVTVDSVCNSIARWVTPSVAAEVRAALQAAND